MKPFIKFLLFSLIFVAVSSTIFAYPIQPRSLSMLVDQSKHIVYAKVIDIETLKSGDHWSRTQAILQINEEVKGQVKQQIVAVYFSPGMICPQPARYEKGAHVLAFLNKVKDENAYRTTALSYGSKELNMEDYCIYKTRILELGDINKITDKKEKHSAMKDWLVRCASEQCTRWEGIYDLNNRGGYFPRFDDNKPEARPEYIVNEADKSKLRQSLLNITTLRYNDLRLIDFLGLKQDKEVFTLVKESYKKIDFKKERWFKLSVMSTLAEIGSYLKLKSISDKMDALDYYEDKDYDKKSEVILKEFDAAL